MTALAVVMAGTGILLVWAGITDTSLWTAAVTTFSGTGNNGNPTTSNVQPGGKIGPALGAPVVSVGTTAGTD